MHLSDALVPVPRVPTPRVPTPVIPVSVIPVFIIFNSCAQTGHITRWEKSHGALLVRGPPKAIRGPHVHDLLLLFFFFFVFLFGQGHLPFLVLIDFFFISTSVLNLRLPLLTLFFANPPLVARGLLLVIFAMHQC
jgi:hypothetical protein